MSDDHTDRQGLLSRIRGRSKCSGSKADKPIAMSVPQNANLKRVTTRWTKGNQTIESTGLIGWDDKWFNFDQEMSRNIQELQLAANGWQRQETVSDLVKKDEV